MKQTKGFNLKLAFTVAEVLIVMGIIGIIAELMIPGLIADFNKAQYVLGLKKAYTVFNQALRQASADNGCINDIKCTNLFAFVDGNATTEKFGDEIVKYFKILKNCKLTSDQDCWSDMTRLNYDGTPSASDTNRNSKDTQYKFTTVDGMSFAIAHSYSDNCGLMVGWQNNLSQVCGYLYVDVNGKKGPNFMGKDVYEFYIANGRGAILYPYGGSDAANGGGWWWNQQENQRRCSPANKRGDYCAGRIVEESWVMNY